MGDAFQCDRCGEFEEGEPEESVPVDRQKAERVQNRPPTAYSSPSYVWEEYNLRRYNLELCSECAERLANFLNGKLGFPDP